LCHFLLFLTVSLSGLELSDEDELSLRKMSLGSVVAIDPSMIDIFRLIENKGIVGEVNVI
jgi:hypothetical protein